MQDATVPPGCAALSAAHDAASVGVADLPPAAWQVREAMGRCAMPGSMRTALHLALPAGSAPDLEVRRTAGALWWRDVQVRSGAGLAEDAAGLAHAGMRPQDVWLDLSLPPTAWLKPLRSGSSTIVFGAAEVLGLPALLADGDIPAVEVIDAVERLSCGRAAPDGVRLVRAQDALRITRT